MEINIMNRAKIVNRYTVEVIDMEREAQLAKHKLTQSLLQLSPKEREDNDIIARLNDSYKRELLHLATYLPFEESEPPALDATDSAVPYYEESAGVIHQRWEVVQNAPHLIAERIKSLQADLAATDYKVTKAYEYSLLGKPSPYDLAELHAARQKLRDKINELRTKAGNSV